jgi:hypothetical protein
MPALAKHRHCHCMACSTVPTDGVAIAWRRLHGPGSADGVEVRVVPLDCRNCFPWPERLCPRMMHTRVVHID